MAWPTTPANNDLYTTAQGATFIYRTSENSWKRLRPAAGLYPNTIVRAESQTLSAGDQTQAKTNMGLSLPTGVPHLVNMRTTSGAYTYNASTKYAIIYLQGGGGSGSSANSSGSTIAAGAGAGGGGADCAVKLIDVEALRNSPSGNTTYQLTIGAGGANVVANTGSNAGSPSSYLDALYNVSTGDIGGPGAQAPDPQSSHTIVAPLGTGAAYETGVGYDFVIPGTPGAPGPAAGDNGNGTTASTTHHAQGGRGGDSFFGNGGAGATNRNTVASQDNADAGRGYGYGGGGGTSLHGGTAGHGSSGGDGCCLVVEFK